MERGVNMNGRRIECISFADDMEVLAANENDLGKILKDLNKTCKKYSMIINI